MQAVAFDTLKLAKKLEHIGFPAKQAQDLSAVLAETVPEWQAGTNLATREDVQTLRNDIQKLEAQTNQRFAEVNQRIAEKSADTIKWVIGAMVAQAGLIIAILKLHG